MRYKIVLLTVILSTIIFLSMGVVNAQAFEAFTCKDVENFECVEQSNIFLTTDEKVYVLLHFSEALPAGTELAMSWARSDGTLYPSELIELEVIDTKTLVPERSFDAAYFSIDVEKLGEPGLFWAMLTINGETAYTASFAVVEPRGEVETLTETLTTTLTNTITESTTFTETETAVRTETETLTATTTTTETVETVNVVMRLGLLAGGLVIGLIVGLVVGKLSKPSTAPPSPPPPRRMALNRGA